MKRSILIILVIVIAASLLLSTASEEQGRPRCWRVHRPCLNLPVNTSTPTIIPTRVYPFGTPQATPVVPFVRPRAF